MCDCNHELRAFIVDEIRREGRITFARFMDIALYYPGLGYYASPELRLGMQGDYFTSPHVHPLFGQMLARQIEEMWRIVGAGRRFTMVEFGAGAGLLARDILQSIPPDFLAATRYAIVELNPFIADVQRQRLDGLPLADEQVRWIADSRDLIGEVGVGCVLSNELIDAFPVHRVKRQDRQLLEIYVGLDGDRMVDVLEAPSTPDLVAFLDRHRVKLAEGQEIEINLRALEWLRDVAAFLDRGFVLSVDYGYESTEIAGRRFFNGSLLGYHKHRLSYNPYQSIGRQDLTAHANFTALMNEGLKHGLATTGLTTQMKFLLSLMSAYGANIDASGSAIDSYRHKIALKQLVMPGGMGEVFKVLIQHKGVERPELAGLKSPW